VIPESINTTNAYNGTSFSQFGFDKTLFENVTSKGFITTTEIQDKVIPFVMEDKDVLGISSTGSGKTAAFLIPMIQKIIKDKSQKLLVVAPTRELALQISKETMSLTRNLKLFSALIIGGESLRRQSRQLQMGIQIAIGTPGRLKDMIDRGILKPQEYNNIVIDEVDRMFDMGFIDDIKYIFQRISNQRQSLFFSATSDNNVLIVVAKLCEKFETIRLASNKPSNQVAQSIVEYTHTKEKIEILEGILRKEEVRKTLIFVETKSYADQVQRQLSLNGLKIDSIHGDKRQSVRKRAIERFKKSEVKILVATNVAARGIDIDDITHVINLDTPQSYDEYIHRVGRTGRNGKFGTAFTFVKK
jgi:superfamily II DNA/RNA helicase